MNNTGIIILAAGSSSRLGRPKQLLSYRDKPLIKRVTGEAHYAGLQPVIVITGANREQVSVSLQNEEVLLVYNERWAEGMGTGISAGAGQLIALNTNAEWVIIAVCDQPFVSASLFKAMMEKKRETGKGIIACAYAGTIGTPVLFDRCHFDALQQLSGDEGAKSLLKKYNEDIATVPFAQGSTDIDTEEDYKNLLLYNDKDH